MFTGLVEGTASVLSWEDVPMGGARFRLTELPFDVHELALGDSLAVNGCCLTVAEIDEQNLSFDLLQETLEVSALREVSQGMLVNVERAMALGDRLGGHLVQGHVDKTLRVVEFIEQATGDWKLTVELQQEDLAGVLPRGSITLDGISLTAARVDDKLGQVSCYLIPHTLQRTNLKQFLAQGALTLRSLNVEFDLIGKFVRRQQFFVNR